MQPRRKIRVNNVFADGEISFGVHSRLFDEFPGLATAFLAKG